MHTHERASGSPSRKLARRRTPLRCIAALIVLSSCGRSTDHGRVSETAASRSAPGTSVDTPMVLIDTSRSSRDTVSVDTPMVHVDSSRSTKGTPDTMPMANDTSLIGH